MQKNHSRWISRKSRGEQSGLSLIELMIAMGIGVVLLLGLVQVFGASRAAFNTAEGMSRVQESGRFAMELLRNELRHAGHIGCVNELAFQAGSINRLNNHLGNPSTALNSAPFAFQFHVPVQGWEATGSGPNDEIALGAGAAWLPAMPVELAAVQADAVGGSDVLMIRYLGPDSVQLFNNGPGGVPLTNDELSVDPPASIAVRNRLVYAVGNCGYTSLFQAQSDANANGIFRVGAGGLNVSGLADQNWGFDSSNRLYQYNMAVFYVAPDVGGGTSLFRRAANPALPAPHIGAAEALIEGVESMQVLYGVDTDTPLDDQPNLYMTADQVNALNPANPGIAWRRVVSFRVGLLLASPQPASDARIAGVGHRVADTIVLAPADGRLRHAYETTVTIRNRVR